MTKKDFIGPFIDFFTIFNNIFLILVRQEVGNFDSSVVVHELELAINRVSYVSDSEGFLTYSYIYTFAPLIGLSDEDMDMDTMITTYNTAMTDAASEILGKERRRKKP